ncbi:MAG: VCBS repeat-containing protein [Gemmatimonadales bacterium]
MRALSLDNPPHTHRSLIIGLTLLLTAWTYGCGQGEPGPWHEEVAYRWRELSVPWRGKSGFTRLSASRTHIDFVNGASQQEMIENRHLAHGSGVTLGDVDGDGLVDVYLGRIDGSNRLYRNRGDWEFEDITERAGVAAADRYTTGVTFADVDGDADLDLLVTALGGPNSLFVNNGSGVFSEHSSDVGLASNRGSTSMTLADVDGDGDLDLYVANYKVASTLDLVPPDQRTFAKVIQRVGDHYEVAPRFRKDYRVQVRKDLNMVIRTQRADPDAFYLNDGTGNFELVPFTSGRFLDEAGRPLKEPPDYFSLSARFYDVDLDGDPDLYVCSDFEDPDMFWINDGAGRFRAAPGVAVRATSNSAMAIDFSDVDRDGDVDFFEADMLSRSLARRKMERPTHTALPKLVGVIENRPQMMRNTLSLNRGDGTFAQIADLAGVTASDWSWGAMFLDVDLDGYEDLLISNGHTRDVMDWDTQLRIQGAADHPDWQRERLLFPQLHQRNVAFRNNGDLTFDEVGRQWGFADEEDVSHGIASGDLDGDGDLDVVINRFGFEAGVFRNNSRANRIAVRLIGNDPNTRGIGAVIAVRGGPVGVQKKEVTVGGLYLSSSDQTYAFATGGAEEVEIAVDWRDGRRTMVKHARPNRLYEILETSTTSELRRSNETPIPYFADVSSELNHAHIEHSFNDFDRQPLLPNELSRLGPGVSWYDVDDDGDEDLLVASGADGTLSYFNNNGGGFSQVRIQLLPARFDQTSVLGIPGDDGETTLLVGQSSYEARTPEEALQTPAVLGFEFQGNGRMTHARNVVGGDTASVGPLAVADYDGDGDLDLFVGGRVIPSVYPLRASSRLYRNAGGRFELDRDNSRILQSVGLVSSAVFSDIDGDGDPDLLLALEWGPLKLFRNTEGHFEDVGSSYGLDRLTSRWNGIATGDLNSDGRLDIVATSWGRNTVYPASRSEPLDLYYNDFDRNGSVDLIVARPDGDDRSVAVPLESFARLTLAMPRVRQRIPTFAAYSRATLGDLVGPEARTANRVTASTFDHVVLLNTGTSFESRPLPLEAQMAPASFVGIGDFDGDGHEDVFLSQNFFPTEIGTSRYDAGRGLWLKGDGKGGLQAVPGQLSGIRVYGDQRGAALADYDADGRIDLVVSQNGAATKLYHNERARPGIRVSLVGDAGNPHAYGAIMRLRYGKRLGPAREIQGGSGYWSLNGAVQVLGTSAEPTGVWIRWADGLESDLPLDTNTRSVTATRPRR